MVESDREYVRKPRSMKRSNKALVSMPWCRGRCRGYTRQQRQGGIFVIGIFLLIVLVAFGMLAVDTGALYQAKSNLENAADSGSLAGAQMLRSGKANMAQIQAVAKRFAELNVPGVNNVSSPREVTVGVWDTRLRRFVPTGLGVANAVRVTVRRRDGQSANVTTQLAQFFGVRTAPVDATAIAAFEFLIDEDGNPYTSRVHIVQ